MAWTPIVNTTALLDTISATDEELIAAGGGVTQSPLLLDMRRLNACAEIVKRRDAADGAVTEAVRRMRARGISWSDIAEALGVTRQAAQQRYAKFLAHTAKRSSIPLDDNGWSE